MRIAIVGAGFSGCQLAVELLRRADPCTQILLFDRAGRFGPGVAYADRHDRLLLNSRARRMSLFESWPTHFLEWLASRDLLPPANAGNGVGDIFVSRRIYGRYLTDTLDQTAALAPAGCLQRIPQSVVQLRQQPKGRGGFSLNTEDGLAWHADAAILCTGILPPQLPAAPGADDDGVAARILANPWDDASLGRISPDDTVIFLGTGLTMVDTVTLLANEGHKGPMVALSRRGLLPRPHRQAGQWQCHEPPAAKPLTVLCLIRYLRRENERANTAGADWRDVIDGLRPHSQWLWRLMPESERRRFLRHLRALWDVHRHRMAPESESLIDKLLTSGRLEVKAGTVEAYSSCLAGIRLRVRPRRPRSSTRLAGNWLINCAGPTIDFRRTQDPLMRDLLEQGLVRPDRLGLGLDVSSKLCVIGADGASNHRLFAMGPLTRGMFGEATAVEDIRKQGQLIATAFTASWAEGPAVALARDPSIASALPARIS